MVESILEKEQTPMNAITYEMLESFSKEFHAQ